MAQASSVQREPSMEEILASIRRIIEDSDTHRSAVEAQSAHAEPEHQTTLDTERSTVSVVEVESFHPELGDFGLDRKETVEPPLPDQSVDGELESPPEPAFEAIEDIPAEAVAFNELPEKEAELADDLDTEVEIEAEVDLEAEALVTTMPAIDAAPNVDTIELQQTTSYSPLEAQSPKTPIMSEEPGRQVAAAFGELSDAFAASRKKSFDEMAEEMMRPMLQDWLDNNLPLLVERLVREEIERVARGA